MNDPGDHEDHDPAAPVAPPADAAPAPDAPARPSGMRPRTIAAWLIGSVLLSVVVVILDAVVTGRGLSSFEVIGIPALFTLVAAARVTTARTPLLRILFVAAVWFGTFSVAMFVMFALLLIALAGTSFAAVG